MGQGASSSKTCSIVACSSRFLKLWLTMKNPGQVLSKDRYLSPLDSSGMGKTAWTIWVIALTVVCQRGPTCLGCKYLENKSSHRKSPEQNIWHSAKSSLGVTSLNFHLFSWGGGEGL